MFIFILDTLYFPLCFTHHLSLIIFLFLFSISFSFHFLFLFVLTIRATGGELFRMIAVDPLPEDKARSVVLQLLEGVEHLHTLNIVHLDLKVIISKQ